MNPSSSSSSPSPSVPMPLYPVMAPYRMIDENEEGSLPFDEILNDTDAQMKSQFQLQQDMLLQNDFMHWRTMAEETGESMKDYGRMGGGNVALEKKMEDPANLDNKGKDHDKQSAMKKDSLSLFGQEQEQEHEHEHIQEQEEGEGIASHSPFMFTSAVIVVCLCHYLEFPGRY